MYNRYRCSCDLSMTFNIDRRFELQLFKLLQRNETIWPMRLTYSIVTLNVCSFAKVVHSR